MTYLTFYIEYFFAVILELVSSSVNSESYF